MPTVTFIDPDGTRHSLEGEEGMSVMELAVHNGLEGIEADCGGACACATCHVYVDESWAEAQSDRASRLLGGRRRSRHAGIRRRSASRIPPRLPDPAHVSARRPCGADTAEPALISGGEWPIS